MDWTSFPWAALVSVVIAIVGLIVWLARLEGKATTVERDLARESKDVRERVGMVSVKADLLEKDIRELQMKSITREDLKEVKLELTASVEAVGERMTDEVNRLVSVITKKPATVRPSRAKTGV